jgi:SAM-dependent methyltransferase
MTATLALLAGLALAQPAAGQSHDSQHSFGDAEKWARVFDDPKRDAWQKPQEVIQALLLKPDAVVADIGAGTGYFSIRLARRLMPRGRVYAVDVEPDMVKYLEERARRERLGNVIAIAGKPEDPRLPDKVDVIFLVNVYHHIGEREQYFKNLRPALKDGGRLAVIDYRVDAPEGPPPHTRIAPERVKAELKSAGYTLAEEHAFLPRQYYLVFRASTPSD